jgi:hypothetical protein
MTFLVLGITILLAALFPIGALFSMLLYRMVHIGANNYSYLGAAAGMIGVFCSFIPAFIVAKIFVQKSNLATRLPSNIPGLSFVKTGVIVVAIFWLVRTLAMGVPGGGAGFVVSSFGVYIIYPMYACILFGVTKALLNASPNTP